LCECHALRHPAAELLWERIGPVVQSDFFEQFQRTAARASGTVCAAGHVLGHCQPGQQAVSGACGPRLQQDKVREQNAGPDAPSMPLPVHAYMDVHNASLLFSTTPQGSKEAENGRL
jgi:hypothetical protein